MRHPVRLRPDNFTPPSRTPWGGRRLLGRYKAALGIEGFAADAIVGESWELSVSDEFPSLCEHGEPLAELIARHPEAMLGDEARAGRRQTALLLKWLDAGDDLSVQIHPADDYAGLAHDESGKLEAWYVVDHEPGAGLYLGFAPGVGEAQVREVLEAGGDLSTLMRFVPVQRGDFALLEPGTPHAVGRGVTLIEPQSVSPGKRGLTYRYWDWNRRYARDGRPAPEGQPRALHVEHALAVTRWERASDPGWLARRRSRFGWPDAREPARVELLCGPDPDSVLASDGLRVARLLGTGRTVLPAWNALRSLTVVEGHVSLAAPGGFVEVPAGCTVALPAAAAPLTAELHEVHAVLAAVFVAAV